MIYKRLLLVSSAFLLTLGFSGCGQATAKILMKFNERYPKEQVKLLETDSSQVVTQIIDHMVDVGFTGTVLE